jgi:predicted acyltransferase
VTAPRPAGTTRDRSTSGAPGRSAYRVTSVDAVRGLAIVILLVTSHPGPRDAMPAQLTHAEWHGLTFADLFFPLFLFAIGAAVPFSRRAASAPTALRRVVLLFLLGIVLETVTEADIGVHTSGVLQHIAVAYLVAWLILRTPRQWWVPLSGGLLAAVWLAHGLVAGPGVDPWGRDGTFVHVVDNWVHGSFRTEGFMQSVTSAVNIVAGALAGRLVVQRGNGRATLRGAVAWTVALVAVGLVLVPLVPVNKRLWTPSFAVLSAGVCFGWFALAAWVADVRGRRRVVQPLVVLGSNPLAVYVVFQVAASLLRRVGGAWAAPLEAVLSPLVLTLALSAVWTALGYLFCRQLWRRRVFLTV